jgi:hypothetical protein
MRCTPARWPLFAVVLMTILALTFAPIPAHALPAPAGLTFDPAFMPSVSPLNGQCYSLSVNFQFVGAQPPITPVELTAQEVRIEVAGLPTDITAWFPSIRPEQLWGVAVRLPLNRALMMAGDSLGALTVDLHVRVRGHDLHARTIASCTLNFPGARPTIYAPRELQVDEGHPIGIPICVLHPGGVPAYIQFQSVDLATGQLNALGTGTIATALNTRLTDDCNGQLFLWGHPGLNARTAVDSYRLDLVAVYGETVSFPRHVTIRVINVPPRAVFNATPETVEIGQPVSLSFTEIFDPSDADLAAGVEVQVVCDPSGESLVEPAWRTVETLDATCTYEAPGVYAIIGRIRDVDEGMSEYRASIRVVEPVTVPCDPRRDLAHTGSYLIPPGFSAGRIENRSVSPACSYRVGIAAYRMMDDVLNNQTLFGSESIMLAPGQSATLTVDLPPCMAQVDLFYGAVVHDFRVERYGARLLDARHVGSRFCGTPQATAIVELRAPHIQPPTTESSPSAESLPSAESSPSAPEPAAPLNVVTSPVAADDAAVPEIAPAPEVTPGPEYPEKGG